MLLKLAQVKLDFHKSNLNLDQNYEQDLSSIKICKQNLLEIQVKTLTNYTICQITSNLLENKY